jgi:hypothetical protein
MHTTSGTKHVTHSGYVKWHGPLSTSVAFLLAAMRPTCLRHLRVWNQSQVCEPGRVASRYAYPGVMLVASDIYQRSCGIVP